VIIIDGLDELSTDKGNNVDDILSLLLDNLLNIKFVLSCIQRKYFLPA
jgi:hypothetical protein